MDDFVARRAMVRAAELCGGVTALAKRLEVDPAVLVMWMRGSAPVPSHVFVKITDILLERKMDSIGQPPGDDVPPPADNKGNGEPDPV